MSDNNKEYTERRGSLIILTITTIIILFIIITAVSVALLVDKDVSKIILLCLIGLLVLVAIFAFVFLEIQRRRALNKRDRGATELVRQIYEQQKYQMDPSPSNFGTENNKTATWALTQPWRYSQRSTLRI